MTLRNSAIGLLACATAVVAGGAFGLPAAARFLEASEPLEAADYILVFAGDFNSRPLHAARLFERGLAPRVVTTGAFVADEVCALGLRLTAAELSARVLQRNGVPPDRIEVLPIGYSTLEEARAFAEFAREKPVASVIVVTSPYHVRRAKLILGGALAGRGVRVMGSAAGSGEASRWWRTKGGLIHLNNEMLKLAFYALPEGLRKVVIEPTGTLASGPSGEDPCRRL